MLPSPTRRSYVITCHSICWHAYRYVPAHLIIWNVCSDLIVSFSEQTRMREGANGQWMLVKAWQWCTCIYISHGVVEPDLYLLMYIHVVLVVKVYNAKGTILHWNPMVTNLLLIYATGVVGNVICGFQTSRNIRVMFQVYETPEVTPSVVRVSH